MVLRGVNLGGWLLLEKWIIPSLFSGSSAEDEYTFSLEDSQDGYKKLRSHRDSYITRDDFEWIARKQFNAVRLPIGYWALDDDGPYLNCREQLDNAFMWATECGLSVILDLHGAPGSQNGLDHSGQSGEIKWQKRANVRRTLNVVEALSKRYGGQTSLWGINLINEPGWDVSLKLLRKFYVKGYKKVRQYCDERVAVIISDTFRSSIWNDFMNEPEFKNVVIDTHLYQCFSKEDKELDLDGHLEKTNTEWMNIVQQANKPVMIGEWSLGLDSSTFIGMDKEQKNMGLKAYADAQLEVFDTSAGWFFWNYKTEDMAGWNFRNLVEAGILH